MANPELKPSKPLAGRCNATDGFSVCTEPPGHDGDHWDERMKHEWPEEEQ
jgi:hypothetical protein